MPVLFLNADLDILSHQNLQPLIDEIGNRACLLASGPGHDDTTSFARYELIHEPHPRSPESVLLAFTHLIDSLSPESLSLWHAARERVIDIGYQCIHSNDRYSDRISSSTLARLASLHIDLAWSFYPPDEDPLHAP